MLNYVSTQVVTPPAGLAAGDTWQTNMQLIPNPLVWLWAEKYQTGVPAGADFFNFLNPQYFAGGTAWGTGLNHFRNTFERFRLAYMGATVTLNAPALSNQGQVVACQHPVEPRGPTFFPALIAAGGVNYAANLIKVLSYQYNDKPTYQGTSVMPCAYSGAARDGIYMPLKMTVDSRHWRSRADEYHYFDDSATPAVDILHATTGYDYPFNGTVAGGSLTSIDPGRYFVEDASGIAQWGALHMGATIPGNLDSHWGDMCFVGLSSATTLSITIRMGLEVMVSPLSSYAPQLKLSPRLDEDALRSYCLIAREMKDAYPESYNSLEKLMAVIRSIANVVLPLARSGSMGSTAAVVSRLVDLALPSQKTNPLDKPMPQSVPSIVITKSSSGAPKKSGVKRKKAKAKKRRS